MTPEAWSAVAAVVGVVAAIAVQVVEWRRQRFSRGIDTISQMDARWDRADFREKRRLAAAHLLAVKTGGDGPGEEATRDILNFFETVGFLHRNKVVRADSVWHFFGSWLLPYYHAAKPVRDESRRHDPNCYAEIERLYQAVLKIERSRHPSGDTLHVIGDANIRNVLIKEAALELESAPSTGPS